MKKSDSIRPVMVLVAILTLLEAAPGIAKAKTSSPCGINVTSILANLDSNNVPLQLQSDGLGPYVTYGNPKSTQDNVNSVIQGSCSWALNTTDSVSRGVVVTLAYPYSNGASAPFVGPEEVKGVFHTLCFDNPANNGLNFGTMTFTGQTLACPMQFAFSFQGVLYALAMNPSNWAGTSWMQVTCSGATSGQCNAWTVQPDPTTARVNAVTNQVSAVAELFLPSCDGCGTGTSLGQYLVSFDVSIHK